jgi:hypothetical protein
MHRSRSGFKDLAIVLRIEEEAATFEYAKAMMEFWRIHAGSSGEWSTEIAAAARRQAVAKEALGRASARYNEFLFRGKHPETI